MNIDVQRLAEMAMLSLENGNLAGVQEVEAELKDIISTLILPELDTQIPELKDSPRMTFREDKILPSLKRDSLLMNAPKAQAGCFVVPKTV